MRFTRTVLTPDELRLQHEVREFVRSELPPGSFEPGLGMQGDWDPDFSTRLADRGWVGMTLPAEHGGGGRTFVERFIVTEELLRVGAPVTFHWVADRQSGPIINRFGTAEQRSRFLPQICAGRLSFAIGMSEAGSGSDLASLSTSATPVDGGWRLDGTKLWTSNGHRCDWLIVLARTGRGERRQDGLTQFLVDRRSPGLDARPIELIDGTRDFSEVHLDGVFVPETDVLGEVGAGWSQNTAELAFERGGPDRWLSTFGLFAAWLVRAERTDRSAEFAAETTATFRVLRDLSLSVARALDLGQTPSVEAALVKELGTRFEQQVALDIERLHGRPVALDSSDGFERLLARALLDAPSFTIRGGTTEVLRTVVARELTSADSHETNDDDVDPVLTDAVRRMVRMHGADEPSLDGTSALWTALEEAGLHLVSIPEEAGGSGGAVRDLAAVLREVATATTPAPLAETTTAAWLLAAAGLAIPPGPLCVAVAGPGVTLDANRVIGSVPRVAWGADVASVVVLVPDGATGWHVGVVDRSDIAATRSLSLGGEPLGDLTFAGATVRARAVVPDPTVRTALERARVLRCVQVSAALSRVSDLSVEFARLREQFGKPIGSFQAVQLHLVNLAQWGSTMAIAATAAVAALDDDAPGEHSGRATIVASITARRTVGPAVLAAHQVHGAIGLTWEFPLQVLTRRARSWTADLTDDDVVVRWGAALLGQEPEETYAVVTSIG